MARLFRVIVPVEDIDAAALRYSALLQQKGRRISPGRHYFDCGPVILVCLDPRRDGEDVPFRPNPEHIYLSVTDLPEALERAREAGFTAAAEGIQDRPWGERSFYLKDPWGNPICFVAAGSEFTGL